MMRVGLIIRSEKKEEINIILNVKAADKTSGWELWIDMNNLSFADAVDYFTATIENNLTALEKVGVSKNEMSLWLFYEYEEQCNLEFNARELSRIGDLGVVFCISCWQQGTSIALG